MSALRWLSVLFVALAFAPSSARGEGPSPKLPDDVFAQPPGDDVVDLVLIGNGRAAIVRVHIKVGARSFRASWGDFAMRLHAFLDRDDDRVLTVDEANRVPWTNLLNNPLNGLQVVPPPIRPGRIDSNPRDGKVSLDELASYLQKTERFEPLSSQKGAPADPRAQAIFNQLDRNGDTVVTPAELSETDALVGRLDRDEDETLSLDELTPNRSPFADRLRAVNSRGNLFDSSKGSMIPLTSAEVRASAARRLLETLGKGTASKIGPEPLEAEPALFKAADGDGDGLLDRGELGRYLESPTIHLELAITLPPARSGQGRVEKVPAPAGSSAAGLLPTRAESSGVLVVEFAGAEIEFIATETQNNRSRLFELRFERADTDKDGAIDAQEARGDVLLQRVHTAADRNGDGKMTGPELRGYIDLGNAAEEARIVLTVSDQGNALYERLDADRDGRFSLRELRAARSKMAGFDADHDGRVSLSELPRRTQLNVGRGPFPIRNQVAAAVMAANPRGSGDRPNLPAWFVGMDRNHDGDVSPREFLGTPDQFHRFDADGDGLIDGDEATRTP